MIDNLKDKLGKLFRKEIVAKLLLQFYSKENLEEIEKCFI